jgi:Glycosyltransferase family 87
MGRITAFLRSPRARAVSVRVLVDVGLVLGGALALAGFATIVQDHGGLGYDTPSYWDAGKHVLQGARLYQTDPYSTLALYTYPPIFAQLFVPFALLPELVVAWLSRTLAVLSLRYITGSWKATVVSCAFLPVLIELSIANVTLELAACILFAMRDRRGSYLLPWAAMIKFGPALIVPYLWFRKPETRRPLVVGTLIFAAACLVSVAVAPRDWVDYVDMLRFQNATALSGQGVIHLIPSGGGLDFVARFGLAAAIAILAAWWRKDWLAYAAASITCPVMAWSRFAPLVGLWRFRPGARRPSQTPDTTPEPVLEAAPATSQTAAAAATGPERSPV